MYLGEENKRRVLSLTIITVLWERKGGGKYCLKVSVIECKVGVLWIKGLGGCVRWTIVLASPVWQHWYLALQGPRSHGEGPK
jgi:hypothetical protein